MGAANSASVRVASQAKYHGNVRILLRSLLSLAFLTSALHGQGFTIAHVTIIDVTDGALHPDMSVTIEGNRIRRITHSPKSIAKSANVIDATGQYLIPGLWDMHTHVFFDHTAPDGKDLILPLLIANGITGVRDMGSNLDAVLSARRQIAAHQLLGPRMYVSGPMLDGPKSTYLSAIAITTPDSGRKAVDMLKSRGVDFIKVQSGVPHDAYFAIADESKKLGIPFEGHVPDAIRAAEAIAAGQVTFEHLIGIFEASSPDEDTYLSGNKTVGMFLSTYDPAREKKIIQLIAQHHTWQCPTLYWERGQWLVDAIDYNKDPDLRYAAHSWVTRQWPTSQKAILASLDTDPLTVRQKFVDHELDIVLKLHAAGVPFLAGTDTPAGVDVIPGISLHLELQRFVAAGFTPLQALQTATLNPAKFLNRISDFGTIEPGRIADLVLLKANPMADISNTRSINAVVADGRYFPATELTQLRQHLEQVAASR